jgi:hypothetical protein
MEKIGRKSTEIIEKNFIYFILYYLILISSAIIIRDLRLDNILISENLTEFNQSILCNDFPKCFRVTTHFVGNLSNYAATFFSVLSNPNFEYVTYIEIEKIFKDLFSVLLRLISIAPIVYFVFKNSKKSNVSSLLITLSFFLIISGFPLSQINNYFQVYLINYDYGSIFLIGIYLNFFEKINQNVFRYVFFLLLASLTFENLPFAFVVSSTIMEIYSRKVRNLKKYYILNVTGLLVSVIAPLTLILLALHNFGNVEFVDSQYYFSGNISNTPKLLIALILLFFWPLLLGLFLSSEKSQILDQKSDSTLLIKSILYGLLFTYFIGFFTSGLSSEGSRQTIGAQLLFLVLGYSLNEDLKIRSKLIKLKRVVVR